MNATESAKSARMIPIQPPAYSLKRLAAWIASHGHKAEVVGDAVRVGIKWSKPGTGEAGIEYFTVRSMTAALDLLGY